MKKILIWLPRISSILYIVVLTLIVLNVFSHGYIVWDTSTALVLHLMPTGVVLVLILIAWRWEGLGAFIFVCMAAVYALMTRDRFAPETHWKIFGPLLIIALLFMLSWFLQNPSRRRKQRIFQSTLFFGLVGTVVVLNIRQLHLQQQIAPEKTCILQPQTGDTVSFYNIFKGEFTKNDSRALLWLVVGNDSMHYHPQPGPLQKSFVQMQWRGNVYIGSSSSGSFGQSFLIYLLSVEPNVDSAFRQYVIESNTNQVWPGIAKLPEQVTILDMIKIVRR